MRRLLVALAFGLSVAVALPATVRANGAYSHIHISQLAVAELPAGELREILSQPGYLAILEAGSLFPDSGYAAEDGYGEIGHWSPFHNAYLHHIREELGGDLTQAGTLEQAVFLLGAMSHGLADQVYDTTLLARTDEVDSAPLDEADQVADYFIVVDQGVLIETEAWAPYEDVAQVFEQGVGYHVDVETLTFGMERMAAVLWIQMTVAPDLYLYAWELYPFLGTHVYNPEAPGSLPHIATLVAAMWQVAWRRLVGTATMDTDLVVGTVPRAGAVNFPVSGEEVGVYRRIGVAFGYAIDRDQIRPLIRLLDPSGAAVAHGLKTPYGGKIRTWVQLQPTEPLAYDTEYTVEIGPGVQNLDGAQSTEPYAFSFRTRCAPEHLDDCPPLAEPLVTGPVPTELPPPPDEELSDGGADAEATPETGQSDASGADVEPALDASGPEGAKPKGGGCSGGGPQATMTWLAALLLLLAARARSPRAAVEPARRRLWQGGRRAPSW